jgi:hypothetical protein
MAENTRKSQLIVELALARGELTTHTRRVRRELDVVARLKSSFQRHGLLWLAGAGALSLLSTMLLRRKKTAAHAWQNPEPKKSKAVKVGMLLTVFKVAFYLVRPALTKWISNQVTDYAESHRHARSRY